eukprot:scaffold3120_cov140-Skeletonema_menzelii.AAC.7
MHSACFPTKLAAQGKITSKAKSRKRQSMAREDERKAKRTERLGPRPTSCVTCQPPDPPRAAPAPAPFTIPSSKPKLHQPWYATHCGIVK